MICTDTCLNLIVLSYQCISYVFKSKTYLAYIRLLDIYSLLYILGTYLIYVLMTLCRQYANTIGFGFIYHLTAVSLTKQNLHAKEFISCKMLNSFKFTQVYNNIV